MKMNIYSLKDKKGSFVNPYVMQNTEQAIRDVKTAVNENTASILSKYPEDFDLYKMGDFDTETGEITSKVEMIINLKELKSVEKIIKDNKVEHKPEINVF